MLRTLHDLASKILQFDRPSQETVVVELRMKDGTTKQGLVIDIRKPKGATKVVIFAEE